MILTLLSAALFNVPLGALASPPDRQEVLELFTGLKIIKDNWVLKCSVLRIALGGQEINRIYLGEIEILAGVVHSKAKVIHVRK